MLCELTGVLTSPKSLLWALGGAPVWSECPSEQRLMDSFASALGLLGEMTSGRLGGQAETNDVLLQFGVL